MNELPWYATVSLLLLVGALGLSLARLLRGPSLPDRVVALDIISTVTVGIIAVYTVATHQAELLGAATVLALFAFLGTVGFARYLEKRARR